MFDVSPENLRLERESAIKFRDLHHESSRANIANYVGDDFQVGFAPELRAHENHSFDHIVHTVPALAYHQPKVKAKSRRPRVHRELSGGLTHAMNRVVADIDFAGRITEIGHDAQFFPISWGLVTLERAPGGRPEAKHTVRPTVDRLSPERVFCDPQAYALQACRFIGHDMIRDHDDMMEETFIDPETGEERHVYNQDVLRAITPDADLHEDTDHMVGAREAANPVPRKQVRFFEIYVPETRKIYTLAVSGESKEYLREPRDFFGPDWGPYIPFTIYYVPDSIYALPPLATTRGLVDELNAHLDQMTDQADQARQFSVVNASNTKAVAAVKNGRNGDILAVPGFDASQVATVTIAGPSPEQMAYVDSLRARLDRKSGITDFQRGNVTGDATLGENQLAAASTDFRRKFMQKQFHRGTQKVLESLAWYLVHSRNVAVPISVPAGPDAMPTPTGAQTADGPGGMQAGMAPMVAPQFRERQPVDSYFFGGIDPEEDFDFADLEITFDVVSMELVSEGVLTARHKEFFAWLAGIAAAIVQTPYLNWPDIVDAYAESMNIQDGRDFVNWQVVEQLIGLGFEGAQAPKTPPGTEGTPSIDVRSLAAGRGGGAAPRPMLEAGPTAPSAPVQPAAQPMAA